MTQYDYAYPRIAIFGKALKPKHGGKDCPRSEIAISGALFTLAWFGMIKWTLKGSNKDTKLYFLVFFYSYLSFLTILEYRIVIYFVVGIVLSPLAFILYVVSPVFVIRPRFRRWRSLKCDSCNLCAKCSSLIKHSSILNGTFWIVTRPVEKYKFYSRTELSKSAETCHLCHHLWQSFTSAEPTTNDAPSNDRSPLLSLWNESFEVSVWIRIFFLSPPAIRLQLVHKQNPKGAALVIEKVAKGMMPNQHP
jgi:hypothetical protein